MPQKLSAWKQLNQDAIDCRRCPRLIKHCKQIAETKRRAYQDEVYWGKPVPNFGPSRFSSKKGAPLLIVGLAPGAHGANRTGRMFTGDRSGDWLYRAMHDAGFANQSNASGLKDGLRVKQSAVTNVCRCAPPGNKPTTKEVDNCRPFLKQTIEVCRPVVILALGGLAWKAIVRYAEQEDWIQRPQPKFGHAKLVPLQENRFLLGSYHPSQQNTFTGKLTQPMFDKVFSIARELIDSVASTNKTR